MPQPSQDNLREVGRWLKTNGEAIYGASQSPFGEEFGDYAPKLKDAKGRPVFLSFNDWRCTAKPGKLYFTLFRVERDGPALIFMLPEFKNRITKVYALADARRTPLEVKTAADGRRFINPERSFDDPMGTVYVVEHEGAHIERSARRLARLQRPGEIGPRFDSMRNGADD